jgi:hypothetical protein
MQQKLGARPESRIICKTKIEIVYLFHDKKPQDYIRKIEKGITTQLPNEKGQKDKQRSTKQKIEQHESD